jgi:hypothetical protein
MTQKIRDAIALKIDQGMPLTKEESCWIYSENRRLSKDLHELLSAVMPALKALLRRATYNDETILLRNAVAKHQSIGKNTGNGRSTRPANVKRVEPL